MLRSSLVEYVQCPTFVTNPNYYYWCGLLSYDDKNYERWISSKGILDMATQEYGAWLRAPLFNTAKKNVITVERYEEGSSSSRLCSMGAFWDSGASAGLSNF